MSGTGVVRSAWVVGAGLVGTSAAIALRQAGWRVCLSDRSPQAQRLAVDLSGAEPGEPADPQSIGLGLVCVAPDQISTVCEALHRLNPDMTVSDTGSTKTHVQREIEVLALQDVYVGGHPLAGRERSGPHAARGDLFEGRPWVLTPTRASRPDRVAQVRELALACRAVPVVMDCTIHDEAMAVVSHVPQVVASTLAARLVHQPAAVLELAGPGLRDTTRIAGSDPQLWTQILSTNAEAVAGTLRDVTADLQAVTAALELVASTSNDSGMAQERIAPAVAVLEAGRRGQHRIPGKHGAPPVDYTTVPVVIPDEPGALARLFAAAGEAGVNVEDVAIEHSPGQPVGLIELAVAPDAADLLRRALSAAGWSVH